MNTQQKPIKGHQSWVCHGPVTHPSLHRVLLNRGEGQGGAAQLHPSSHFLNVDFNSEGDQNVGSTLFEIFELVDVLCCLSICEYLYFLRYIECLSRFLILFTDCLIRLVLIQIFFFSFILFFITYTMICLSVCQQDYLRTIVPVNMKLGGMVQHWPRRSPLDFGEYLSHGADAQIIFHFC